MPITRLDQMLEEARRAGPARVAVAAADDPHSLEAIKLGLAAGLLSTAHLYGDPARITYTAGALGLTLTPHEITAAPDCETAARLATTEVYQGGADLLMKGSLPTACLLKAVLAAEREAGGGEGPKHLLSHVAVMQVPAYHKLMLVTDAGMVIAPNLEEKIQLIVNAQSVTRALGIRKAKVAVLAAVETVNPKMPATTDAEALVELAHRGRFPGLVVDGPLSLDLALSAESANYKGVESPVAGEADIFLVPSIEVGNVLGKALLYLAGGKMAGVVAGARAPIPLTSRSESSEGKLYSLALAILCARASRTGVPGEPPTPREVSRCTASSR